MDSKRISISWCKSSNSFTAAHIDDVIEKKAIDIATECKMENMLCVQRFASSPIEKKMYIRVYL